MISGNVVNSPSVTLYIWSCWDRLFSRVKLVSSLESRPRLPGPLRSSVGGFIVLPLGGSWAGALEVPIIRKVELANLHLRLLL